MTREPPQKTEEKQDRERHRHADGRLQVKGEARVYKAVGEEGIEWRYEPRAQG
jgi:hypothetical protein